MNPEDSLEKGMANHFQYSSLENSTVIEVHTKLPLEQKHSASYTGYVAPFNQVGGYLFQFEKFLFCLHYECAMLKN